MGCDLPDGSISALVESGHLEPVGDHWSDAEVYLLTIGGSDTAYLKIAPVDAWYPLRDEAERLDWVDHRVPSPGWWKFETIGEQERLLTAALPGLSLRRLGERLEPGEHVRLHAEALRVVHDTLPPDGCPFELRNEFQVQLSCRFRDVGKVDPEYLSDLTGGWSVDYAFDFLRENMRPEHLDDVVLHGDPYAANLIVDTADSRSMKWGLIDWGWCGVGDRWHDLSNIYVHLDRRLGLRWAEAFLSEYGIDRDDDALQFFRVLDGLR